MIGAVLPSEAVDDRTALLRGALRGVRARWRTPHAIVYGSVLRADFGPASDVDILVVDDDLNEPFRSMFHFAGKAVSVNLVPTRAIFADAGRLTYGGYYAAKFALPAVAMSYRSAAVVSRSRDLLMHTSTGATSPAQAAVRLFPAYRAFLSTRLMRSARRRIQGALTPDEQVLLARFRAEGRRMHASDPGWWRRYKTRTGIPESWD
ncbi:nucleotidyltransferase domain-containing protein [Micromonospora zhanjiangensis]|uniref:Nucleotidyltransferase domain-containing protein n=1 Tax=Micromonospora zhanjiangensis TaxID=1522057 RepID=A0ABV8KQS5_9ACTN